MLAPLLIDTLITRVYFRVFFVSDNVNVILIFVLIVCEIIRAKVKIVSMSFAIFFHSCTWNFQFQKMFFYEIFLNEINYESFLMVSNKICFVY